MAFAVHVLVFGSLFSGLPGPAALGELRGEGALPGVLTILLAAALTGAVFDVRGWRATILFAPLTICILMGLALNADDIANAHFMGREGGEKFATSLLVVAFYLSFFFAAACIASVYGVRALLLNASNAAFWCGLLLVGEMIVEVVTWFVPPLREIWREVRTLWVAQGSSAPMYRLVGFAPEPSLGAITAMGLLGLLACGAAIRRADGGAGLHTRTVSALMLTLFALELVLANARTFTVGVAGAALAALLVTRFARRIPASLRSAVLVLSPLPVQAGLMWAALQQDPAERSISNITRSVGMLSASHIWSEHPWVGVGLGQYGFHFRSTVPSWAAQSFEISRFFRDDQYDLVSGLPPSFSLFSRVAAELGLLGLAAWLLPPMLAIRGSLAARPGLLTGIMVCALAAQLWAGLSLDSYRNLYYWLWLALLLAWPSQVEGGAPRHATTYPGVS